MDKNTYKKYARVISNLYKKEMISYEANNMLLVELANDYATKAVLEGYFPKPYIKRVTVNGSDTVTIALAIVGSIAASLVLVYAILHNPHVLALVSVFQR